MRTKIVATLGPASMDRAIIKDMARYGVRILRLNFSHADAAFFEPIIHTIREIESELGVPLTVMADLCGPKIRIGEVEGSPITILKGDTVSLGLPEMRDQATCAVFISLDRPEVLKGLDAGMPVSLSDGMLQFKMGRQVKRDVLYEMEALNGGMLTSNKGIAFPGKHHALPALTDKDRKDLHEGLEIGVDAVALSFVQHLDDIKDVKAEIDRHGSRIPVVAKLERQNAVDNLDSILTLTDAVMVARGDLGLECPLTQLAVTQKKILRACRHAQRASIVATQMLLSMVKNPIPTRAEATDVANAMMDGADCVMLSEETAIGAYPVEAVRFIHELAESAEAYYLERIQGPYAPKPERNPAKYLAYSACLLAEHTESEAIVCHSESGATARQISTRRPAHPVYALTTDKHVFRALNYCWGVKPRLSDQTVPDHLNRVEKFVQECGDFTPGKSTVLTSGQPTPGQKKPHTNEIKIYYK
jgi:pyruvate kinase